MPAARSRSLTTLATGTDKKAGAPQDASTIKDPPSLRRLCRRRGAALETAIYEAVLQQLSTVGFAAMTIEGIAATARTGKAAIYRRWPSKEELVADTLDNVLPSLDLPPDTGNVRTDIARIFDLMTATMESPAGGAMQALLGELGHDHEFIKTLHVRVLAPRKALMLEILRRGVERGDVKPDAVKPVIAEAGPALLVHRLLMYGPPIDPAYVDAILDDVVMPLISPAWKEPSRARS
ncbi:MAG TPA: TetR/AcrR family transcriptional regulator [Acidothermaceae bacterium]